MSTTSPLLSSEAIDLWNRLRNVFSKLDEAHVLQDSHLRSAYPLHEELVKSANVSSKDTSRWRDAISEYKLALEALKQEAHYLTIAQSSLAELHSMLYPGDVGSVSKQGPDSKKLKKRLSSTDLKRPQVTFPTIPIQLGSDVAVRTTDETSDKYERYEWIWARVVSMKGSSYEVEDIDNKKILHVTEDDLLPLIPDDYPDFPIGATVLANFPDTTAFYKALVHSVGRNDKDYIVSFEGDGGTVRKVPKRLLVQYVAEKFERP